MVSPTGLAIGFAIGVALFAASDNLAVGIAVGAAFAIVVTRAESKRAEDAQPKD